MVNCEQLVVVDCSGMVAVAVVASNLRSVAVAVAAADVADGHFAVFGDAGMMLVPVDQSVSLVAAVTDIPFSSIRISFIKSI